jgi:hypothetical protein
VAYLNATLSNCQRQVEGLLQGLAQLGAALSVHLPYSAGMERRVVVCENDECEYQGVERTVLATHEEQGLVMWPVVICGCGVEPRIVAPQRPANEPIDAHGDLDIVDESADYVVTEPCS